MSRAETIRAYLAQRYIGVRFVVLAMLLTAIAVTTSGSWGEVPTMALVGTFALVYLLVLVFRVWDDVEDREQDAQHHPERVTVTGDVTALHTLAGVIAVIVLVALGSGPQPVTRLATVAAMVGILLAWYRLRKLRARSAVADAHVLLLKYPLIAMTAAPVAYDGRELAREAPVFVALYLLLCTYEWLDDPHLRRRLSSTTRGPLP